ncbi:MAG: hypothetical protein HC836_33925 [Richelia sp. RM2_1_2]|nr:hypothetical protein [Richelia sp. RM2_1_2]
MAGIIFLAEGIQTYLFPYLEFGVQNSLYKLKVIRNQAIGTNSLQYRGGGTIRSS